MKFGILTTSLLLGSATFLAAGYYNDSPIAILKTVLSGKTPTKKSVGNQIGNAIPNVPKTPSSGTGSSQAASGGIAWN